MHAVSTNNVSRTGVKLYLLLLILLTCGSHRAILLDVQFSNVAMHAVSNSLCLVHWGLGSKNCSQPQESHSQEGLDRLALTKEIWILIPVICVLSWKSIVRFSGMYT